MCVDHHADPTPPNGVYCSLGPKAGAISSVQLKSNTNYLKGYYHDKWTNSVSFYISIS